MTDKPIVHFKGIANFYSAPLALMHQKTYGQYANEYNEVEYARVYGLDHPILGEGDILTSIVVQKHPNNSFETLNTLYVPVKETNDKTISE